MKLKSNVRFVTGSLEGVDKDFSNGADVIQELLTSFSQENSLPLDQERLLQYMRVNASRHEYLIAVSPTLLPISLISSVLRIMHGQLLRILPVGGEREMVLSGIRIIDCQTAAHNNFYLDRCMKYREKYKEYTDSVSDLIKLHRNLDGHLYDMSRVRADPICPLSSTTD
jgi:hypothetical protein